MNSINGLMRINVPERVNRSNPNAPNISKFSLSHPQGNPDQEVEQPEMELDKITGRYSLANKRELSIQEKLEVMRLEQLERSVREHERAHLRTARDLAVSGPTFEYQEGPDGKKYAVKGEVQIDSAPVSGDAEATVEKAFRIQRTALAPSDPSPKDLQAAARARIIESKAHRKLTRETQNQDQENLSPGLNAYQTTRDYQENLYKILELFA